MKYSLVGVKKNAEAVVNHVKRAMKKEGKSQEDIDAYVVDATSGDNYKKPFSQDYYDLVTISARILIELNQEMQV